MQKKNEFEKQVRAYNLGWNAALKGKKLTKNPFNIGSSSSNYWNYGWSVCYCLACQERCHKC